MNGHSLRGTRSRCARRTPGRVVLAVLLAGIAAGCNDSSILDQEAPSRIEAKDLERPENAGLLVTSAIGDFECALANVIVAAGRVGDELIDAQLQAAAWDYDRRTVTPGAGLYALTTCGNTQNPGLYLPLSVARFQADNALRLLDSFTDAQVANRTALIAQAAAFAGYSLVLMGEVMCSAAIDVGPELLPVDLFTQAEARFTRAIEAGTASSSAAIVNLARVGRARARINLGKINPAGPKRAEAAADAALVPANFVFNATYSAVNARRENLVNTQTFRGNFSSVDPSFRNVTFAGVPDPRVAVQDAGLNGQDALTRIFRPLKYPAVNTPIPIATWEEAQLIIAEVEVEAGTPVRIANAVTIINALHTRAGLPPYAGVTQAEVRTQVIEERRRELFLEGHRLNDLIRFNLPLVPAPGTPFLKGGTYASQLCFPLPDVERQNNPNI